MVSAQPFKAGTARTDITPELGLRLTGYAVREGTPLAVDEPLSLTVLALSEGEQTILIVAADLCLIDVPCALELRRLCADAAGIACSHVLLNVNHSHSAPGIGTYVEFEPLDQQKLRAAYWHKLQLSAVDATRRAVLALEPARVAVGWGECRGNINRRQKSTDGTVLLGEDPAGACDSSVGVIRVDSMNGRPLAVAFRYSCHTVTLGPKTNRVSPDFAGPARRVVESALGCPSLFLQGCAGNINPATGIGQDADDSPCVNEDKDRLGHMLGGEVLKVAQTLRTHRRRCDPVLVESVGRYWLYGYEPVPPILQGPLAACETQLTLPLTPFPALPEVEAERAEWAAKLQAGRKREARGWNVNPLLRFDYWAQKRLDAARHTTDPVTISFPLQALRIGSLKILAIPFEAMAETGIALRNALGPDTFVLGFSNGIVSYLPTPEISSEGGMEAKLGYKAYLVPSEVPGTWEPVIRESLASLPLSL